VKGNDRSAALCACLVWCTSLPWFGAPAAGQCGVPANIGGGGGLCSGVDIRGDYAFSVEHARLTTWDLADPVRPRPLATLILSHNFLWDVKVSDGIAVGADAFWGVRMVDVHDPGAPFYLSTYDTPYGVESVAVADSIVYAADGDYAVQVIDITDPRTPTLRSSITIYHAGFFYAQEVVVVGSTLYVGSEAYGKVALDVVDVANPSAPIVRGFLVFTPGYPVGAGDLHVSGTTVYLTDSSAGLHIIDASNPSAPVQVGALPGAAGAVKTYGARLLLGRGASLDVVDVSNPASPAVLGNVVLPGAVDDIAVSGVQAMLSLSNAGLAVLDLSDPDAPALAGTSGTPDEALDVVVEGGLAYVADGRFGLKILDLSNPLAPAPVGRVDTPGSATGVAVAGSLAYVADGTDGLQLIDIHDPAAPAILNWVDTPGTAVEVAVAAGKAYVADGPQGLRILDVSDPNEPYPLGGVVFPGVNSEATSVCVSGNFAYLTDRFYGLRVVDVSSPAAPQLRATVDTFSYANDVVLSGTLAYVSDYSKRLYVIDVSNPSVPVVLWSGPQPNSSGNKLALAGDRLYLSQNQGGYFDTFDVTNPMAPVQLAAVGAPTLGGGLACWDGYIIVAHGGYGVRTYRADGLPEVRGPRDTAACVGASASLSVAAAGQAGNGPALLSFTWRKDGVALVDGPTGSGSSVAGAATPVVTITNLSSADEGSYDCVVTNACGSSVSQPAALAVGGPGDVDVDGDVDLADAELFAGCMSGPDLPNPGCDPEVFHRADTDADGDADLGDFASIQQHFGRPCP